MAFEIASDRWEVVEEVAQLRVENAHLRAALKQIAGIAEMAARVPEDRAESAEPRPPADFSGSPEDLKKLPNPWL